MVPVKFINGPLSGGEHLLDDQVAAVFTVANCTGEKCVEVHEYRQTDERDENGAVLCEYVKTTSFSGSPDGDAGGAIVLESGAQEEHHGS